MSEPQEEYAKQRRHNYHTTNLAEGQETPESKALILRELSQVDDLPINPGNDPVMGQLVSKLTSTSNLTPEEVRSNEWIREYIMVLYLCKYPRPGGLSGAWRGYAHGDRSAEREPLDPEKRTMIETFVSESKLALKRSEDAKVIEEATRSIRESVTRDESDRQESGGGILGRLRG